MNKLFKLAAVSLLSICTLTACDTHKQYMVTEEEWNALTNCENYTVDLYENGDFYSTQKYTEEYAQIGNSYIIFEEDAQFHVTELEEYGWVASEISSDYFDKGKVLQDQYSDFEYNKETKSYVLSEEEYVIDIKFENGLPIVYTYTYIDNSTTPATTYEIKKTYRDINKTTITLPEFIYDYEIEDTITRTVDEETWNKYKDAPNYTLFYYVSNKDGAEKIEVSITENAVLFNDQLYVIENGTTYLLEEKDSKLIATEAELTNPWIYMDPLLSSLNYSDFTYNEQEKYYYYSKDDGNETYKVSFADGVLTGIMVNYVEDGITVGYVVYDFGTTTIKIPEYTIENN